LLVRLRYSNLPPNLPCRMPPVSTIQPDFPTIQLQSHSLCLLTQVSFPCLLL
jgi:hypothetical protein